MNNEIPFQLKEDRLLKRFEDIHNFIYANDGLSPQQVLDEIIKILFIKLVDESHSETKFFITDEEYKETKDKHNNLNFLNRINQLFEQTKKFYQDVFEYDDRLNLSNPSLAYTVSLLQNVNLSESSNDVKGLAFQKFLASQQKGDRGQYFTPEPVIDLCVKMIAPKSNETIIDPACGSGGFLHSALKYNIRFNSISKINEYVENYLYGIDINKRIAKIAKMKLLLESDSNCSINISCFNTLEEIDYKKINKKELPEGFDIVLTNPPFGTVGKITSQKILRNYSLGHKWMPIEDKYISTNNTLPGQAPEILFIEACTKLLKQGGRMAIILPNGHLENPTLNYLRYYLKSNFKIFALIKLPPETFIPYGTGVKTSILFLRKETPEIKSKIFFSQITKIGYQGNKNGTPIYKKDTNGNFLFDSKLNKIVDEDYNLVHEYFETFQNNNTIRDNNSFNIRYKDLMNRFDYDFYLPSSRNLIETLKANGAVPLKDLVSIIKEKSSKLNIPNEKINYVELSDINSHSFEIINSTEYYVHELPSRASYDIKEGDIITAVAGNSIGTIKHATAFVEKQYENSICTNGFRVLRNFSISPFYLLYFFKTEAFLNQVYFLRTGAAIPSISNEDFSNILIYIPSTKIINKISDKIKDAFHHINESRKIFEEIKSDMKIF